MIAIFSQERHKVVTCAPFQSPSLPALVKKLPSLLLLVLGLFFSGCAMTVPINPSLLMLLLKDDAPPPKLEILPATNNQTPASPAPAEIARDQAAAMG